MAFRWRSDDGPTLNAGLVALCFFRGSEPVLLRNPIFCDFSGGSGPPVPPLDPHIEDAWGNAVPLLYKHASKPKQVHEPVKITVCGHGNLPKNDDIFFYKKLGLYNLHSVS